jgi:hypothetical protein
MEFRTENAEGRGGNIPEDGILHSHRLENFKSYFIIHYYSPILRYQV